MQDDVQVDECRPNAGAEPRLHLDGEGAVGQHVDGAWWPRSTVLSAELPLLLSALSERLGRIALVGYHRNGWTDAPPQIEFDGDPVPLLGFSADAPASIIVIDQDGRHITLQVIPPGAGDAARRAFESPRHSTADDPAAKSRSEVGRSVADLAHRLARREGRDDPTRTAEIRRWSKQAFEQFADAPVQTFVPILVEHIVRDRMLATRSSTKNVSDTAGAE